MTRNELFTIMMDQNIPNINAKLDYFEKYILNQGPFSDEDTVKIKRDISRFKLDMKIRWIKANSKEVLFRKENERWLEGTFMIPKPRSPPGRPQKLFSEASERSKRRKTEELRNTNDLDVLTYATQAKLSGHGKRDASLVLKDIISTPKRATKYKKAFTGSKKKKRILN